MGSYKEQTIKIVSEDLKRKIVEEIESGNIGQCEASRLYGIQRGAILKWLKRYGKFAHTRKIVEVVMKDEKEKIEQLQQALADAQLKIRLYDRMLDMASEEYKTDIKKNFYTEASNLLRLKERKLKKSAD